MFNFGGQPQSQQQSTDRTKQAGETYKVPDARAAGRPHELGWLDLLKDSKDESMRLGKMQPGRIIADS